MAYTIIKPADRQGWLAQREKGILHTHTDWTGTYVETTYKCDSVNDFINNLLNYIEEYE